jgi:hypothetical protein
MNILKNYKGLARDLNCHRQHQHWSEAGRVIGRL